MQKLQEQLQVDADPAEVGRARRWARARLAGSGLADDEQVAETLVLLVSELVTNAVVHTGCPAVLRLQMPGGPSAQGVVRVEVGDRCAEPPRPRAADEDETHGRGLELVDGLADRWGWEPDGPGKRIWCEIDHGEASDPAGRPPGVPVGRGGLLNGLFNGVRPAAGA